ncbi:HD-GYP domain-containing protein [Rheinheimera salexigens]|uniref:HD family phosphohydrolase n=1 Tax=Rheinheimera salexigens TaxID=1628148 RepID=A0A1E7Q748_9GAMM|nr:HD-GYP domain-containing protein [Rheinheimera salexigens]OEY69999.1 HD family phosphohydrolase [Rheinheimera salexigens]
MTAQKIKPAHVELGYAITLTGNWKTHPLISENMLIETAEQLNIIQNLDVEFIYFSASRSQKQPALIQLVSDESATFNLMASEAEIQLQHEKQQRREQAQAERRHIQRSEKAFNQSLLQIKNLMQLINSRPLQAISDAGILIEEIADTLLQKQATVLHLIVNGNKDQEKLYYHSLNVAMLSMMLAKSMQLTAEQIKIVGIGALFHDIGKLKIPTWILRKPTALSSPEQNLLKMHTKFGIDLVSLVDNFPLMAWPIIEQHHEFVDGSGYPKGLKLEDINPLARIVTIVNIFDGLCNPPLLSQARTPHHAFAYMFKNMSSKLAQRELSTMIKMMGVYPPGTIVKLSDDRVAIVMSVNTDNLLCPYVMAYDDDIPRLDAPIISLENDNLSIMQVLKIQSIPSHIATYLNPRATNHYYIQTKD